MLHELLFIECVKVSWQSLRDDWLHYLSLSFRSSSQFESLVGILICGLLSELSWFVLLESNYIGLGTANLSNRSYHLIVLFQLFGLISSE